jgi:hypothetical protein
MFEVVPSDCTHTAITLPLGSTAIRGEEADPEPVSIKAAGVQVNAVADYAITDSIIA